MKITTEHILDSYEQGDVVLIEELLKVHPESEELRDLEERCWTHEHFQDNGESYEDFKEDYARAVSAYIKQDFITLLEENGY